MATAMRPASITIAWNTSVHTTAFRPPCYRQKQRIKYKTDKPPRGYDCFLMSEPRLHAPFDVRASFTWYHSTTLHYQRAVDYRILLSRILLEFQQTAAHQVITGTQPKVGTGHKIQTISFFQRYIVRDIPLTWGISLAQCAPVSSGSSCGLLKSLLVLSMLALNAKSLANCHDF